MINSGLFTSNKDDWETPQTLFNKLDEEFNFSIDLCANKINHKKDRYYSISDSTFKHSWDNEIGFLNPPYGRDIDRFIKKAYESKGIIVCLIPSRTDTKYWHNYVMKAKEIRFIKGRLKFEDHGFATNPAPFPSAIVVFDGIDHNPIISSYEV